MFLPIQRWYDAVSFRHSVRRYTGEPIPEELLDSLERTIRDFHPFDGARAVLVRKPADKFVRRFVGALDKTGVVHYVAFIGDMNSPHVQEATGYLGEGIILEATSLGLNTCWIAALIRKDNVAIDVGLLRDEEILTITPIGYAEKRTELIDELRHGRSWPHKRKEIEELVLQETENRTDWAQRALEAARVAPSAANRQPWRFSITPDSVTISVTPTQYGFFVSPRLDCGIAALHAQLGAMSAGVRGRLELLGNSEVARFVVE